MQAVWIPSLVIMLGVSQPGCTIVTAEPSQPAGGATGAGASGQLGGGNATSSGGSEATGFGGSLAAGAWMNVTSNLATLKSECGNLSALFTKPDEDLLIAGVGTQGLWASADGGQTWTHMGDGKRSDEIVHRPTTIVFDPADTKQFWEAGIYGNAAYRTSDAGDTFTLLGDAQHCDLLSVDLSDPARKTLLAGGHEQSKTLNRSTNGGKTWTPVGTDLPDKTNCTLPLILDSATFLVGCAGYGGGFTGIYRSTDAGESWSVASIFGGASPPLVASDGSIYWATANPGGMARSTDNGETWQNVTPANLISTQTPVELPDARIATVTPKGVAVSEDQGSTWRLATAALPYDDARTLAYSAQEKAFFVSHFSCDGSTTVPSDAVMRADFDYEAH